MGNIYVFSLIFAIISALILFPIYRSNKNDRQPSMKMLIAGVLLLGLLVFVFYYLTNLDRNFSSFWFVLLIISAIGTVLAKGLEQMVKAVLFLLLLLLGVYFLTAPMLMPLINIR
jgi:hypothetical protein